MRSKKLIAYDACKRNSVGMGVDKMYNVDGASINAFDVSKSIELTFSLNTSSCLFANF